MTAKKIKVPRVERTRNAGSMTEAEYFSRVRSALRNAFKFWKPMQAVLKKNSRPSQSLNKKLKTEYQCAACGGWFPRKEVQIDHIVECGSLRTYEDIAPFLQRLTLEDPNAYQILCKKHHKHKTTTYIKGKRVVIITSF
jgi:hypothetical protein